MFSRVKCSSPAVVDVAILRSLDEADISVQQLRH
jgi:hypothetical protein